MTCVILSLMIGLKLMPLIFNHLRDRLRRTTNLVGEMTSASMAIPIETLKRGGEVRVAVYSTLAEKFGGG